MGGQTTDRPFFGNTFIYKFWTIFYVLKSCSWEQHIFKKRVLPSTSLCSNDFVGNTLKWINLILVHACNAMREMKKSRFLRFYVLFICVFFLVLVWFFKWQNWHTRAIVRLQQSDWLDEEIWGWAWPIRNGRGGGQRGFFNEMFVFF